MAFQHTDEFYAAVIRNSYNAAGDSLLPVFLNDEIRTHIDLYIQRNPAYDQPEDFLPLLPGAEMHGFIKIAAQEENAAGKTPLPGSGGGTGGGDSAAQEIQIFSINDISMFAGGVPFVDETGANGIEIPLDTRLGRLSAKYGVPKKCCSLKSTGCGNDLEKYPHEFLS